MRVFVTGGSGFVGGHVIEALVGAGHEVVAMARSDASARIVEGFGARASRSALGAVEPSHLAGCDAVVHAAAFVEEWGTREQFQRANVDGTQNLLDAAKTAGVGRFVFIGTEAALFDGHDLVDVDETAPYPTRQRFLYSETKAEAERRVLAANGPGFTTVSVRPRLVWGPRDATVLPAIVEMVNKGAWSWLDGGRARTSTTHVRNLAHAVLLALETGRGGQAYFVADDGERSMREFLDALARTRGVALPNRSMPGAIARPLATAVESLWRLFGIRRAPPMTSFTISMMSRSVTVRTDKARAELGYRPIIGVDEGLAQL
ncbi:MAG: NAD-dependent epimerase/dehydratase family protein [Polyangiaceae bacterium]|nr:NAD-dependent epimerase/dehydratase family protein [Polyangiaceae bacterium]